MLLHIKAQVKNPQIPESSSTLDQTMHLQVSFNKLVLTWGSFYIVFPEWIAKKKRQW